MTYKNASRLLRAVKASGLPYTQVPGWKTRGRREMRDIRVITAHHTATPRRLRPSQDYPTMNVVKNGRPGIPGPLAQIGLGRSGRVYLIAAGVANHAGKSRTSNYTNPHAIGIEAEGAMEAWPRRQYDAYVRLCRALADEFKVPVRGHKETAYPPGRKNDPSFNMNQLRADIARAHNRPTPTKEKPQKKGLLGMSLIAAGNNNDARTIKPGTSARMRMGKYFSMCDLKTGQTVRPTVRLAVKGAHEEDVLHVQARIVDYKPKDKHQDVIVGSFYAADYHGRTGAGWSDYVYVGQPYHVHQKPRSGGSLKLQLEVENRGKNPITIHVSEYTVEGD